MSFDTFRVPLSRNGFWRYMVIDMKITFFNPIFKFVSRKSQE